MKNMKYFIAALLLVSLTATSLVACNSTDTPNETGNAATGTATEGITEAPTSATPETVTIDVVAPIRDQDGATLAGITVHFTCEDANGVPVVTTATSDAEGYVSVTLAEGNYTVSYENLPEGYLGNTTSLEVRSTDSAWRLEVTNNTPNGTEERPFVMSAETMEASIPAGTTYCYYVLGADGCTLTVSVSVENASVEITYKEAVYTPDENGVISVLMSTDSPRDHAYFFVTNKGSEAVSLTMEVLSPEGSWNRPIAVTALGEAITASVPQGGIVYYSWTAAADGTLVVRSSDAINNISINDLTTSQVSDFSQGGESVSLAVKAGHEIVFAVSAIGGDKNAEYQNVTFTVTAE